MSVESDLVALLTGDATVGGLIGSRVYPLLIPQDTAVPAVAYQEIAGTGESSLGLDFPGLAYLYQLRLVDDSYLDLLALRTAVLALSGSSQGDIGRVIFREGPDDYDRETGLFSRIIEARIT